MIIWSGQGDAGNLMNDVWSYSFNVNQWNRLWADSNVSGAPLKRYGTASVFEPVTRRITTFAGFTTSGRFEDTWTFDVSNLTWADRTSNTHPPKRCLHSGVYADDIGKFIIYGGQDTGPLDDIWQCDLGSYTWSNLTPQFKPPGRFWGSMIYFSTSPPKPLLKGEGSGSIIIFGGLGASAKNDMWKFNLSDNAWESVQQGSVIPRCKMGAGKYLYSRAG